MNILLIEDDRIYSEIFKSYVSRLFEGSSYNFFTTDCLSEVKNIVKKENIDIIFSDLTLKDSSPEETMTELSKIDSLPIILITVKDEYIQEKMKFALQNCFIEFYNKSEVLKNIKNIVNRWLHLV